MKNPPNNLIFPTNVSEVNQNHRKVKSLTTLSGQFPVSLVTGEGLKYQLAGNKRSPFKFVFQLESLETSVLFKLLLPADGGKPPHAFGSGQQRPQHPRPFFYVQPPSQPYFMYQQWPLTNPYSHYGLPGGIEIFENRSLICYRSREISFCVLFVCRF